MALPVTKLPASLPCASLAVPNSFDLKVRLPLEANTAPVDTVTVPVLFGVALPAVMFNALPSVVVPALTVRSLMVLLPGVNNKVVLALVIMDDDGEPDNVPVPFMVPFIVKV